jgi:DNA-directed RNA polymerase subunit RPC12/RpoP
MTLGGVGALERVEKIEMDQKVIPSTFDWPLGQRPSDPNHLVDYICGNCESVLLHAVDSLKHDLLIICTDCGAQNSSDARAA